MYLPALIVAIAAFLCFAVECWEVTHVRTDGSHRHLLLVPAGLMLFVAAFILQLTVQTGSVLVTH